MLLAFGMVNVMAGFFGAISQYYGTPVYPVTRMMLNVVGGSYIFIVFAIIVYYAGELVHRERQVGIAEIVDATPFPNGIMVASKIVALWFIIVMLLLVVTLASIAVQIGHGYFHIEPLRYLVGLFVVHGWQMYLLCVMAVCIQTVVRNKYLGMLVFMALFFAINAMNSLGYEHVLYQFGVPTGDLSDMNGWGHYVEPMVTVGAYWSLWMVVLGVFAHLFMRRGNTDGWKARMHVARGRFTTRVQIVTLVAVAVPPRSGTWIFHNTNVLNRYETADSRERGAAEYEQRYKQYQALPMPEAIDVDAQVDIFPAERRIESRGVAIAAERA